MWRVGLLLILTALTQSEGMIESDEDTRDSGNFTLQKIEQKTCM